MPQIRFHRRLDFLGNFLAAVAHPVPQVGLGWLLYVIVSGGCSPTRAVPEIFSPPETFGVEETCSDSATRVLEETLSEVAEVGVELWCVVLDTLGAVWLSENDGVDGLL